MFPYQRNSNLPDIYLKCCISCLINAISNDQLIIMKLYFPVNKFFHQCLSPNLHKWLHNVTSSTRNYCYRKKYLSGMNEYWWNVVSSLWSYFVCMQCMTLAYEDVLCTNNESGSMYNKKIFITWLVFFYYNFSFLTEINIFIMFASRNFF